MLNTKEGLLVVPTRQTWNTAPSLTHTPTTGYSSQQSRVATAPTGPWGQITNPPSLNSKSWTVLCANRLPAFQCVIPRNKPRKSFAKTRLSLRQLSHALNLCNRTTCLSLFALITLSPPRRTGVAARPVIIPKRARRRKSGICRNKATPKCNSHRPISFKNKKGSKRLNLAQRMTTTISVTRLASNHQKRTASD